MKKYFVTGGAGFIGSYIVNALIDQGHSVFVYDLKSNKEDDIRNLDRLLRGSAGCDGIFHLAAIPSVQFSIENPKETFEVNFTGTLNVLEAARINKIKRVVYSSSSAVYGDQEIFPIKEDANCKPQSPYAVQKYMGEHLCKLYSDLYGVETISLRYFNVYGQGQSSTGAYASVIAKFLSLHSESKPLTITGSGNQTRDFIHVRDVVKANISAMESSTDLSCEYFNIGSGVQTSVNSVAKIFSDPIAYIEARHEPQNSCADISKAERKLGWTPKIDFKDGLGELIAK